jgi:hypothetical protein
MELADPCEVIVIVPPVAILCGDSQGSVQRALKSVDPNYIDLETHR